MNTTESYSAVILDLDGVLTDTRNLHYDAWKQTFDEYLRNYGQGPFSQKEYEQYVDGKPRSQGILDFLIFRGIPITSSELQKLGQRKNEIYLSELDHQGVVVFSDALRALRKWRDKGVPLAVVSSSKNTTKILDRLRIRNYFEVEMNALIGEEMHLEGKPSADFFLEAAKRLNKKPDECIVVEDAVAGIQAGNAGNFASVIGVARPGQTGGKELSEAGADFVVTGLEEIFDLKPNIIKSWRNFAQFIDGKEMALFLDFDGTLSEIVPDHHDAQMVEEIRPVLTRISDSIKVAIISGRDRKDVKARVGIDGLFYAGCHGYDISGPGCFHFQIEEAEEASSEMNEAIKQIESHADKYPGLSIERKKYFTAIHYRNVDSSLHQSLKNEINDLVKSFKKLEVRRGKMVFDLAPKLKWNKGEAVKKLCEVLDMAPGKTVAVYIGDDLTDEDVFCELHSWGIGIKVGIESMAGTCSDYSLRTPSEVATFLNKIEQNFTQQEKQWRRGA
ncbi:trehalose-phosphatase [Peredibacter starrii]|uniref:Trehalose 6-phosphate phosphatase n=1 Tax=Peredibacter starrii TaxID=28202 RepID=A0AAX4HU24_9BACT|nr:trehalose-phosphatase [Peredibacter starrii]WPU66782.1 trehalose-phosphatase [Peredibacter starrii]